MTKLNMTRLKFTGLKYLGAAAVVATALASPAMAQEVIYNPGYCAQFYPDANCQNKGPGNPYTGSYQRHTAYRADRGFNNQWNGDWNSGWNQSWNDARGFEPRNAYAYDNRTNNSLDINNSLGTGYAHSDYYANAHAGHGWNGIYSNSYNNSYGARNGFVCEPGSIFRGEDGRKHRCQ
jgi:hypothetical protein